MLKEKEKILENLGISKSLLRICVNLKTCFMILNFPDVSRLTFTVHCTLENVFLSTHPITTLPSVNTTYSNSIKFYNTMALNLLNFLSKAGYQLGHDCYTL